MIRVGDMVKIEPGAYAELAKRGWASNVPLNLDGKVAKVTADFSNPNEYTPHFEVEGTDFYGVGVPPEFLTAMGSKAQPSHLCPKCGQEFTDEEQLDGYREKAIKLLSTHGLSYRGIGRLLGGMHPQSVKYWAEKAKEKSPEALLSDNGFEGQSAPAAILNPNKDRKEQ